MRFTQSQLLLCACIKEPPSIMMNEEESRAEKVPLAAVQRHNFHTSAKSLSGPTYYIHFADGIYCLHSRIFTYRNHKRQWSSINNETKSRYHYECENATNNVVAPSESI